MSATKPRKVYNLPEVTSVPLLDTTRIPEACNRELKDTCARVIDSGQFILGPEVETFEKTMADFLGVTHAIGVSSGTDALILALMTLGVEAGDEVICPSFTFFATAGAVWRLGAKPVFVDIEPATFNIDVTQLEAAITPAARCRWGCSNTRVPARRMAAIPMNGPPRRGPGARCWPPPRRGGNIRNRVAVAPLT